MTNKLGSSVRTLTFLMLALLLAGCSLFGSGTHRHSSVSRGDELRPAIPDSDKDLERHVPQQLIVRVESGTSFDEIGADLGAEVIDTMPSLNAALLRLPADVPVVKAMRQLNAEAGVRYAEPNYVATTLPIFQGTGALRGGETASYSALSSGPGPFSRASALADGFEVNPRQWGIFDVGADKAWDQGVTGEGVVIAILDTGIAGDHPDLQGPDGGKIVAGTNTLLQEPGGSWDDEAGHGTHVAGIAAAYPGSPGGVIGVAYGAKLLAVKVLGEESGDAWSVAKGIDWVISWREDHHPHGPHGPTVINMSLGGPTYNLLEKDAVDAALHHGIVVVAAMGNDARGRREFPAAFPGVVAVGAVEPGLSPANFSTSWRHISVSAPGVDIFSSYPKGTYGWASGTSMATPFVAGAAALLLSDNPHLSPEEVRSRLESTARRPADSGRWDDKRGYGVIDIPNALSNGGTYKYGTVIVEFTDQDGDPITPAKYNTPPSLYQGDFFIEIFLDHPWRPKQGPIFANSEGIATLHHVPADDDYTLVVTVSSRNGPHETIEGELNPVSPDDPLELEIQLDLCPIAPVPSCQ